jgi:hypothetical protein
MMGEARVFFRSCESKKNTHTKKNRPKRIIDIDFGGNITQASTGPRPPNPYRKKAKLLIYTDVECVPEGG